MHYPVPNTEKTNIRAYYGAYLSLYIERDVRQIQNIKDISAFEVFLQLLAGRAGNLLNIADIAKDCGLAQATCKAWLSILENSRIIYLLHPWYRNTSKRLIKSPKIYFTDTGLLAYLLKYPDSKTLMAGPAMGAIFENMIIIEFLKEKLNRHLSYDCMRRVHTPPRRGETKGMYPETNTLPKHPYPVRSATGLGDLYFYRDSNGVEIDLVVNKGRSISLYEIKASKTLRPKMTRSLKLADFSKDCASVNKYLVSFHENKIPLDGEITAIPWQLTDFGK
jgi:predicted AAA+ superfamily ATPase